MSEDDWRIYAGLLKWARANRDILRHNWCCRRTWNSASPMFMRTGRAPAESWRSAIRPTRAGSSPLIWPKRVRPGTLRRPSVIPSIPAARNRHGLGRNSTLALRLEPWELVFLEILPRAALQEPVAIGGRWYRDGAQTTGVVLERGVDRVRVLHPREGQQSVAVTPRQAGNLQAEVTAESCRRLPEGEWLSVKEQRFPTAAFELECSLEIPPGVSRGKVLLLCAIPCKSAPAEPLCRPAERESNNAPRESLRRPSATAFPIMTNTGKTSARTNASGPGISVRSTAARPGFGLPAPRATSIPVSASGSGASRTSPQARLPSR